MRGFALLTILVCAVIMTCPSNIIEGARTVELVEIHSKWYFKIVPEMHDEQDGMPDQDQCKELTVFDSSDSRVLHCAKLEKNDHSPDDCLYESVDSPTEQLVFLDEYIRAVEASGLATDEWRADLANLVIYSVMSVIFQADMRGSTLSARFRITSHVFVNGVTGTMYVLATPFLVPYDMEENSAHMQMQLSYFASVLTAQKNNEAAFTLYVRRLMNDLSHAQREWPQHKHLFSSRKSTNILLMQKLSVPVVFVNPFQMFRKNARLLYGDMRDVFAVEPYTSAGLRDIMQQKLTNQSLVTVTYTLSTITHDYYQHERTIQQLRDDPNHNVYMVPEVMFIHCPMNGYCKKTVLLVLKAGYRTFTVDVVRSLVDSIARSKAYKVGLRTAAKDTLHLGLNNINSKNSALGFRTMDPYSRQDLQRALVLTVMHSIFKSLSNLAQYSSIYHGFINFKSVVVSKQNRQVYVSLLPFMALSVPCVNHGAVACPAYMAPEVASGKTGLTAENTIWSAAAYMHYLMGGRAEKVDSCSSVANCLQNYQSGNDATAYTLLNGNEDLNSLLFNMLHFDPAIRPSFNSLLSSSVFLNLPTWKWLVKDTNIFAPDRGLIQQAALGKENSTRYTGLQLANMIQNITMVDYKRLFVEEQAIGQGATATVYQAFNVETRQSVALKVYTTGYRACDVAELIKEAYFMHQASHCSHVPRVYGLYIAQRENLYYGAMAMELGTSNVSDAMLSGSDSGQVVPDQKVVLLIMKHVFLALDALHGRGVMHGDLKAENILLEYNADGTLKRAMVADLGNAHMLPPCSPRTDAFDVSAPVGTAYIEAPECILGQRYTLAKDIWSAGVLFVEMLSGIPLYESLGISANDRNEMERVHSMDLRPFTRRQYTEPVMMALYLFFKQEPGLRPTPREALELPLFSNSPRDPDGLLYMGDRLLPSFYPELYSDGKSGMGVVPIVFPLDCHDIDQVLAFATVWNSLGQGAQRIVRIHHIGNRLFVILVNDTEENSSHRSVVQFNHVANAMSQLHSHGYGYGSISSSSLYWNGSHYKMLCPLIKGKICNTFCNTNEMQQLGFTVVNIVSSNNISV